MTFIRLKRNTPNTAECQSTFYYEFMEFMSSRCLTINSLTYLWLGFNSSAAAGVFRLSRFYYVSVPHCRAWVCKKWSFPIHPQRANLGWSREKKSKSSSCTHAAAFHLHRRDFKLSQIIFILLLNTQQSNTHHMCMNHANRAKCEQELLVFFCSLDADCAAVIRSDQHWRSLSLRWLTGRRARMQIEILSWDGYTVCDFVLFILLELMSLIMSARRGIKSARLNGDVKNLIFVVWRISKHSEHI